MDLLTFRELFRNWSGRYDLVNDDFSDNGADFLINAGQRYLDRLVDIPKAIGRVFAGVSQGDYIVTFQDCRSILEVWSIGTKTDGSYNRLPLTKYTMKGLRGVDRLTLETNYVEMFSDISQDRPTYYAVAQLRMQPDTTSQAGNGAGGIAGFMDVMGSGHETYNGIIFMPPADASYTIEIVGNFYSKTLSEDTDVSHWSEVHPEILLMATMRQAEIFHRNTAGVLDWTSAINDLVIGIDMDGVAEDIADDNSQMVG